MLPRKGRETGFTLAELIVAAMLLSVVLAGVYTAFGVAIRLWRAGEADANAYQDARVALAIMSQELRSMLLRSGRLLRGDAHEIEFVALTPRMDVEEGAGARVLWVKYRLKADPKASGKILVREEAEVKGPLPVAGSEEDAADISELELGRKSQFELASGVLGLNVAYYRLPVEKQTAVFSKDQPPGPVEWEISEEHRAGAPFPEGIQVTLKLADTNAVAGSISFGMMVTFRKMAADSDELQSGRTGLVLR